ncbi:MAG: cytochrome c peroxidase [Pseudomonadota bacterium]
MSYRRILLAALGGALAATIWMWRPAQAPNWSPAEVSQIESLWIENLPPLPVDPTNAVADDPDAAEFGHALFFDTRLSANGAIACATCHQPIRHFSDGLRKGVALGMSKRNTPSIVGTAYSPWLYWDGRRDSLWSQALSPLEDPNEHGSDRMQIVRTVQEAADLRRTYEDVFGPMPDFSDPRRFPDKAAPSINAEHTAAWRSMTAADRTTVNRVFSNLGKALAAYERRLVPAPARFDEYAAAVAKGDKPAQRSTLSAEEAFGLRLFIGKARCTECHNGPLFTNNEFHNTGILSAPGDLPDRGRSEGLRLVRNDPFNCAGAYSDAPEPYCAELDFAREGIELIGAVRTPSLRNLQNTAPFMHRGQLDTLLEIVEHYDEAPLAMIGHNEAKPLSLSGRERRALVAFLQTLFSPPAADERWLAAPALVHGARPAFAEASPRKRSTDATAQNQ